MSLIVFQIKGSGMVLSELSNIDNFVDQISRESACKTGAIRYFVEKVCLNDYIPFDAFYYRNFV